MKLCPEPALRAARGVVAGTVLLVMLAAAGSDAAAQTRIQAAPTDITSNSDRIVSYRHQEHFWQTADGGLHLVINRGSLEPGPGLSLFSSHDGGATWRFQLGLPGTDEDSVSDGQLVGDTLSVLFQTGAGDLVFQRMRYDAALQRWHVETDETAFTSSEFAAVNPAFAADAQGTLWCAFVRRDRNNNNVHIRLLARPADGTGWLDTGLVFGPTDRRSIERSARPVPIAGGIGMVYTVREITSWAERLDTMPLDAPWAVSTLLVGTPTPRTADPYASHFSVVADDLGQLHLATVDDNRVLHFTRSAASGAWSASPLVLSGTKKVGYAQSMLANGRLVVAWSAQRGFGNVAVSEDHGASFSNTATLVLPPDAAGVSYGQARVELPTRSNGPVTVLQQYTDNGTTRLMRFTLPAP